MFLFVSQYWPLLMWRMCDSGKEACLQNNKHFHFSVKMRQNSIVSVVSRPQVAQIPVAR